MPEKHTHRAAFVFHEDCPRCQELLRGKRTDVGLVSAPPTRDFSSLQEPIVSLVESVSFLTDRLEELERQMTEELLDVSDLKAWRQAVDADRAGIRRKLQTHEVQVHGRQNA